VELDRIGQQLQLILQKKHQVATIDELSTKQIRKFSFEQI
jgi:hypothetical protein